MMSCRRRSGWRPGGGARAGGSRWRRPRAPSSSDSSRASDSDGPRPLVAEELEQADDERVGGVGQRRGRGVPASPAGTSAPGVASSASASAAQRSARSRSSQPQSICSASRRRFSSRTSRSIVGRAQSSPIVSGATSWKARTIRVSRFSSTSLSVCGDERERQRVNPRVAVERGRVELGQLLVVAAGQVAAHFQEDFLEDVVVIGEPFGVEPMPLATPPRSGRDASEEPLVLGEMVQERAGDLLEGPERAGRGEPRRVRFEVLDAVQLGAGSDPPPAGGSATARRVRGAPRPGPPVRRGYCSFHCRGHAPRRVSRSLVRHSGSACGRPRGWARGGRRPPRRNPKICRQDRNKGGGANPGWSPAAAARPGGVGLGHLMTGRFAPAPEPLKKIWPSDKSR